MFTVWLSQKSYTFFAYFIRFEIRFVDLMSQKVCLSEKKGNRNVGRLKDGRRRLPVLLYMQQHTSKRSLMRRGEPLGHSLDVSFQINQIDCTHKYACSEHESADGKDDSLGDL